MTATQAPVVIAGAGIGGLTTALALHAKGIDAIVLDRARELRPLGVGINLLPHAVDQLNALGLGTELARISLAPSAIGFYDSNGELLFREPRGIEGGYDWPQFSVHRGDLQMLLLSAVRDRIGANAVHTGARVTAFRDDPFHDEADHVELAVDGRTDAPMRAKVLVGADGLHSAIRAQLHPGPDPLLWSGVRMWRGATAGDSFLDGRTMVIIKSADGVDAVIYRIGGRRINWVVQVPESAPRALPGDARWNAPGRGSDVTKHLDGWNVGWLDVRDLVSRTESVFEYPMVDRDVLPSWGRGRVTLLGDAAHPMYPVGANGGSQAILDARALADELADSPEDYPAGLRSYEDQRRAATADVIAANREMHGSSAVRAPAELARVAAKYRHDTGADQSSPQTQKGV